MTPLVLYCDRPWVSPWVMHALVALEEKQLPYRVVMRDLPLLPAHRAELAAHGVLGKLPMLVHGDVWISESLAISEYLAETFPIPDHPRLFPPDLGQRARARQVMSWLRTDGALAPLREARPTTSVFGAPVTTLLGAEAQAAAAMLLDVAKRLLTGRDFIADAWCIADVDLALTLMRLIKNGDPVPAEIATYAARVWTRPSVAAYLRRHGQQHDDA